MFGAIQGIDAASGLFRAGRRSSVTSPRPAAVRPSGILVREMTCGLDTLSSIAGVVVSDSGGDAEDPLS